MDGRSRRDQRLMQKWTRSWAIREYAVSEEFERQMVEAGFGDVEVRDVTRRVDRSVTRLFFYYYPGLVYTYLWQLLGWRNRVQTLNTALDGLPVPGLPAGALAIQHRLRDEARGRAIDDPLGHPPLRERELAHLPPAPGRARLAGRPEDPEGGLPPARARRPVQQRAGAHEGPGGRARAARASGGRRSTAGTASSWSTSRRRRRGRPSRGDAARRHVPRRRGEDRDGPSRRSTRGASSTRT